MRIRRAGLTRFVRAAAAVALSATLISVDPSPTAAAPEPGQVPCTTQVQALEAVQEQIEAHNAQPHTFRVPEQAAQLAAYNAEATELDGEQAADRGMLEACATAVEKLLDDQPGSPPYSAPSQKKLDSIDAGKKLLPANWNPQVAPPAGDNWEIPRTSPERPLYEALRKGNPGSYGPDVTFQGAPKPKIGDPDPAYPGDPIPRNRSNNDPGPAVSPDHIVPLAELMNLPGFMQLNAENMYRVVTAPLNLQWISTKSNQAKQSRSMAEVVRVDPTWAAEQAALEQRTRAALNEIIQDLLKSQGGQK
jgi:hypothetical protein